MSQGSLTIADGGGLAVLAAINAALARLASKASGTARPSDIATGEVWIETDNPGTGVWSLWLYDGASDILLGTINSTTHAITWAGSIASSLLTTQGDFLYRDGSGPARLGAGSDAFKAIFSGGAAANPTMAGTWKVLGEATPAAASVVDFTGIPASVLHLFLQWELIPGTNAVALDLRTYGADGVLDTGAGDYLYNLIAMNTAGASGIGSNGAIDRVKLHSTTGISSNASYSATGHAVFTNIQAARYTQALFETAALSSDGNFWNFCGVGVRNEADRITGIRLLPGSGTITGRAVLLGMSS